MLVGGRRQEGLHFAEAEGEAAPAPPPASLAQRAQRSFSAAARGWRTYAGQPIAPAAVALALLYLTVMSFVRRPSSPRAFSRPLTCVLAAMHALQGRH
jgi:hypothetical protein